MLPTQLSLTVWISSKSWPIAIILCITGLSLISLMQVGRLVCTWHGAPLSGREGRFRPTATS